MAGRGNFENRLISVAGEETLKKAKALLKSGALVGVWRDRRGLIDGVFCENGFPRTHVKVRTGEEMSGECPLCPEPLCRHAVALIMYAGRFPLGEKSEAEPYYYGGMRSQPLGELIRRGCGSGAELTLTAQSTTPHVPSKWESIDLRVRLCDGGRECAGNLNNLRNLYFDKSVNVVIRYGDFSLQEQQIIRFLALYGEPAGAGISLDAELTAELFHSLVGFPRFFRDGRSISVRGERAEPALLDTGKKLIPGVLIEGRPLPAPGAKIVAGRSGCWIGCGQDYFFIPGKCEVGFMRSFFRSQELDRSELARYGGLGGFQLPVIRADGFAVRERRPKVLVDGNIAEGKLSVSWSFVYPGRNFVAGEYAPGSGAIEVAGNSVWRRDTATERRFAAALGLFGFKCRDGAASLDGDARIALFLNEALPELHHSFDLAVGSGLTDYLNGLPEVRIVCSYLGADSDAGRHLLDCRIGDGVIPWENAVSAACNRAGMLLFADRFFKMDDALVRFLRGASRVLKRSGDGAFFLAFRDTAYFNTLAADVPGARLPELFRDIRASVPVKPPRLAFAGVLRGYQREGVEFMQFLTDRGFGALLADEMGLGKTVQLLAFFASRYGADDQPGLVVCPASLVVNWKNEAERFLPGVRAGILRSSGRRELADLLENSDLVIISYAAARLNSAMLKKHRFSTLILDEAQHIKNPGSGNARICKDLAAARRIVLSGTPLENSPEDLWSIMDFLQPGMLGTLPEFRRTYGDISADDDLKADLAARVAPFIKRRTKLKVAPDLPERSELTLYCELAPEQRKLYDGMLARGRELLRGGSRDRNGAAIFEVLLRLRQICCHPRLLPGGVGENIPSAKGELLTELLHENIDSGHKMLLFSQFTSMLQLLTPELDDAGIVYEYLDGATRDRQKRVDRFNRDDAVRLFLLSLKAGGTGLNLTAADTVIIYDPWWNPAVESQAADRTHRIGQTKPVNILKLVVKDTIEEKVQLLQEHKRRIFDEVVADPAAAGGFTLEELAMLFD